MHVIFGAGQVGTALARTLLARGRRVRLAHRSGSAPDGAESMKGDVTDEGFTAKAAEGAAAIYHCVNPPYFTSVWARELPRIADSLIGAAVRSGARLVAIDNLYMYGRPNGRALDEDSPIAPSSRKGEIRAKIGERYLDAHRKGDAQVVIGRASDFYGPAATSSHFGDPFWPKALSKGMAQLVIRPDTAHTYHYLPDVALALAQLGEAPDDVLGRAWMLPCARADTTAGLVRRIGAVLRRELKIQRVPGWMLSALGVFVPLLRELREMSYQWDEPFVVSDRRFRERFGAEAIVTSLDDGARAAVEWAKQHYASR
jgi:nucleoside-diphosphate-sugar epimerase